MSTEITRNGLDPAFYNPGAVGAKSSVTPAHALPPSVEAAAHSDAPVLILGKRGSQAESIARQLHGSSDGNSGLFIALNCSALAPESLANEIFGNKDAKGAGLLQVAEGGTLFLNDISALSAPAQVRLLRELRKSESSPNGGAAAEAPRVRVIASTATPLQTLVTSGGLENETSGDLSVIDLAALSHDNAAGRNGNNNGRADSMDGEAQPLANGSWSTSAESASISDDVLMMPFTEARALAIELFDKEFLTAALARHAGNIARTARSLGLHRQSLQKLMGRRGIKVQRPSSKPQNSM